MIKWWYPGTLPDLLREIADYLEETENKSKYRHPAWIKALKVSFNKLSASQMKQVLKYFNKPEGVNLVERKKLFNEIILTKLYGYEIIRNVINQAKEWNR